MSDRTIVASDKASANAGSSLVPMLVAGIALTLIGMVAAVLLS